MNTRPPIGGSYVHQHGRKGTYKTAYGGIGLGYDISDSGDSCNADIVKSGGNGYYYPVADLAEFVPDGGAGYMQAVRKLSLPPSYLA